MPPEGVQLSKQNELLSVAEITRISKILAEQRSLRKIRLTGGVNL
jgi:molybdenum cofactor biosynthesis enzyme MoaA